MRYVARITSTAGRLTADSTITVWDGSVAIKQIPVPLKAGPSGHLPLVRIVSGLMSIGFRLADGLTERPVDGGSEFDVVPR